MAPCACLAFHVFVCVCPFVSWRLAGGAALGGLCDGKDVTGHLGFLGKLKTSSRESERATLGTCHTWYQA